MVTAVMCYIWNRDLESRMVWYIDVENNSTADLDNLYKSKDLTKSQTNYKQTGKRNLGSNFIFKRGLGAP